MPTKSKKKESGAAAGRTLAKLRKTFGGGRPQLEGVPRRACGEMTLKRALARGHKCSAS
jgi:hypothetical protein